MKHFYIKIFFICIASSFVSEAFCAQKSQLKGFFNKTGRKPLIPEVELREQGRREANRLVAESINATVTFMEAVLDARANQSANSEKKEQ